MSGSPLHGWGRVGRSVAALAAVTGTLALAPVVVGVGQAPAGAASGCGVTLGSPRATIQPPFSQSGSPTINVQLAPTVAGQGCNTTISVTGTIATSGGVRPTNVAGNGQTYTVKVTFLPNEPPPTSNGR